MFIDNSLFSLNLDFYTGSERCKRTEIPRVLPSISFIFYINRILVELSIIASNALTEGGNKHIVNREIL